MSQSIPIYIPTYISDATYNPSRVLPRLLFYNGMLDCQKWYIDSGSSASPAATAKEQYAFPYFDNYNVVSGSFPTTDSKSLLFFNEQAVYGEVPNNSLYNDYWETYVELLYNPRTRLLNASAIIPLADYFKMELNDVVQFRGNYYHLRAINDYNLKNGECSIQLLGPILPDALPFTQPVVPTTTTTSTTSTTTTSTTTSTSTTTTTTSTTTAAPGTAELDWSFTESGGNGTIDIYLNGMSAVSRNATSNGTITGLVAGDEIYYDINQGSCTGGNNFANAYSFGIISDASCDESVTFLSSAVYTVQPGDIGTTLTLDLFGACDSGCV